MASGLHACYLLRTILRLLPAVFIFLGTHVFAQRVLLSPRPRLNYYYTSCDTNTYWLCSSHELKKASDWLSLMEASDSLGLYPSQYPTAELMSSINEINTLDSAGKRKLDAGITGAVLLFIRHLQQGNLRWDYDEVMGNYDTLHLKQLNHAAGITHIGLLVAALDCHDRDYLLLKRYLNDSLAASDTVHRLAVSTAMNYRRYFSFLRPREFLVVNIPAAEAEYFRNDSLILKMRTVVGKTKTRTPVFASFITNVEINPPWNVPHSIAVKEILPSVQQHPNYLEQNNFEVVDARGNMVDDSLLDWKAFNERNFPYFFRQSAGADNALGVIKFNLRNPYSVFLHATSFPAAFTRDYRYLSHGCVRLEKPLELARSMLGEGLDEFGDAGSKETLFCRKSLGRKVPAFIIYSPLKISRGQVVFLRDEYHLLKQL